MISNKSILIFLLNIFVHLAKSQNEVIKCNYYLQSYSNRYQCDLLIQNPNGLNNFQDISGTHLDGKTDNDVNGVYINYNSDSLNFPSIICDKFKNLGSVEISGEVQEIHDYSLKNCINLHSLSISGNIKKINKNAFTENINLLDLRISQTELTTLPVYVFPKLGNSLTFLSLSYNKLNNVKLEWFKALEHLETLRLDNNEIEELPLNIFVPAKNLTTFSMNFNRLKVLSAKSFYNVSKLDYSFNDNSIEAVDENFIIQSQFIYNKFSNNFCLAADRNTMLTMSYFEKCIENYRAWETG